MFYSLLTGFRVSFATLASKQLKEIVLNWYSTALKVFVFIFKKQALALYVRRGAVTSLKPMLSDLDLALVVEDNTSIQAIRKSKNYKIFTLLFPMAKEIEIIEKSIFQLWCTHGGYRSFETKDWTPLTENDLRHEHDLVGEKEFKFFVMIEIVRLFLKYFHESKSDSHEYYKEVTLLKYHQELLKLIHTYDLGKYSHIVRSSFSISNSNFYQDIELFFERFSKEFSLKEFFHPFLSDDEFRFNSIQGLSYSVNNNVNDKLDIRETVKFAFKISTLQEQKFFLNYIEQKNLKLSSFFLSHTAIQYSFQLLEDFRTFDEIFFSLIKLLRYDHHLKAPESDFHVYCCDNFDFYQELIDVFDSSSTIREGKQEHFANIEKKLLWQKIVNNE